MPVNKNLIKNLLSGLFSPVVLSDVSDFNPTTIPNLNAAFDDRSVFNADGSGNLTSIQGYNGSVFLPLSTAPVVETDATTGKTIVRATNGTTKMNLQDDFTAGENHTIIAVYRTLSGTGGGPDGFLGFSQTGSSEEGSRFACLTQNGTDKSLFYGRKTDNTNHDTGYNFDNNWTVLWLRYNSTTSVDIGVNDEFVTLNLDNANTGYSTSTNMVFFTIDTFASLENMAFASFAHYTRALTDAELVTYLRAQVAKYNIPNVETYNDALIVGAQGQSNMNRLFTQYSGANEAEFESVAEGFYPFANLLNGSEGGTALRKSAHDYIESIDGQSSNGYFYNDTTGVFEDLYTDVFLPGIDAGIYDRRLVKYVITDGNFVKERDAITLGPDPIEAAGWKDAQIALSSQLRQDLNSGCKIGFLLGPNIDRESTVTVDANAKFQQFIDLALDLVEEQPSRFFIATQAHDTVIDTDVHYDEASGDKLAARMARKIAALDGKSVTGVDGPRITGASYSGSTVTVTVAQDAGTDFDTTITSPDLDQFHIEADGVNVAVTAIAYTNATTLTLTMASSLAGSTEVLLWNGWNTGHNLTAANIITDNATPAMPLQRTSRVVVSGA